jgi:hypothetical protein
METNWIHKCGRNKKVRMLLIVQCEHERIFDQRFKGIFFNMLLDVGWIFLSMSQDATMLKKCSNIPIFLDKCKYFDMLAMSQYTCGMLRQIT